MRKHRRWWIILTLACFSLAWSGCSSSEELSSSDAESTQEDGAFTRVDKEESIIPETEEPVEIEVVEDEPAAEPQNVPVQTPAGTPETVEHEVENVAPTQPAAAPKTGAMMWSVQLGAFKNESGAFQLVEELKKKFNQPVYKRYDAVTGYYKVTLGSYQSRDDAAAFKLDVQSNGYPDAFTVQVAR
ncbi:MAG: hypothetical protein C0600_02485 [Ignavibacteria bacterium]|nr:MAG: hypothetical protein C0600_02485 [Ignavibacteria bacterium]